ncbi:hypothetical protein MLD38_007420 [Melastoma candidum]|uniref:Uncharacterized protein n=1 Tax=Melastoma candidum TaxID=119954 RepID=A0ACB9RSZ6_9MYRT|nr:hypothetical protein MLD38_007420 [Melastoma candidum]
MERFNFVKDGVLRLPPGFRFHPTDQELVLQYLRRKVYGCPLPASVIPEFDVCRSDPWDLPGDRERERYFFSTKEAKYPNGNRANRATISGYWKSTGIDKAVLAAVSKNRSQVLGMKKTLVFYRGKPPRGSKTDWIMHEYSLAKVDAPNQRNGGVDASAIGNWVLCRIFLKRRNNDPMIDTLRIDNNISCVNLNNPNLNEGLDNNRGSRVRKGSPIFYYFMGSGRDDKIRGRTEAGSNAVMPSMPSSSSRASGQSGVTEVSSWPGEEEDSSCSKGLPCYSGKSS